MNTNLQELLETMVDEHGLAVVLDALAMVAFEKAEHARANWQDRRTAEAWEDAGGRIAKLASKCDL